MNQLFTWLEIPVNNMDRAVSFYSTILNIKLEVKDFGNEKMACFPNAEGALSLSPGFTPSENGILPSMNIKGSIDLVCEKIKSNGGKILTEKQAIDESGENFYILFLDTEGNRIGIHGK